MRETNNSNYDLGVGARQVGRLLVLLPKGRADLPRPYQAYPNLELLKRDLTGFREAYLSGLGIGNEFWPDSRYSATTYDKMLPDGNCSG